MSKQSEEDDELFNEMMSDLLSSNIERWKHSAEKALITTEEIRKRNTINE